MATPIERLRNMGANRKSRLDKAALVIENMKRQADAAKKVSAEIKGKVG